MSIRTLIPAFVVLLSAELALARIGPTHGYKTMSEQADLVAIATPTQSSQLPGTTTLPNLISISRDGKRREIPATRVRTTFRLTAILKVKHPTNSASIELIHLKLVDPADALADDAQQLIEFKPADRAQYLMFLKANSDGTYEPITGQEDPIYSFEKLQQTVQPRD
jgi:hypothetical protein